MMDSSVPLWKQPERPLEERIDDLVSRLSLEEKSESDAVLLIGHRPVGD